MKDTNLLNSTVLGSLSLFESILEFFDYPKFKKLRSKVKLAVEWIFEPTEDAEQRLLAAFRMLLGDTFDD